MNPNVETSPGMGLPQPLPAEGQSWPAQGAENAPMNETAGAAGAEVDAARLALPSFGQQDTTQPVPAPSSNAQAIAGAPATAGDNDSIEKEWVDKAKQIVNATKADPYQQNRQLAAFKADYLQKRYNKTIKLSE